jgi:flavin-dependent dehydrogenase
VPQAPVTIVGGGPAGAAAAIALARMGMPCRVLEADTQGRVKAGETLPGNVRPVLHQLGLSGLLDEGGHLPCFGNVAYWGGAEPSVRDFIADVHGHGWHLDRQAFERQLREAAVAAGVDWQVGVRVTALARADAGWEVQVHNSDGKHATLASAFVLDATGRAARIARGQGAQRITLDKLAGYFALVEDVDVAGLPHHTIVESVADGWWYAAAVPGKRLAISFLSDSDLHSDVLEAGFLAGKFAETVHFWHLLGERLPDGALTAYDVRPASTACLDRLSGPGWLAVGDAAFSYDPLSSYGIGSALGGGLYAAFAVRDHLAGHSEAMAAYAQLQGRAFQTCLDLMAAHYAQETRWADRGFWARRR